MRAMRFEPAPHSHSVSSSTYLKKRVPLKAIQIAARVCRQDREPNGCQKIGLSCAKTKEQCESRRDRQS